MKKLYGKTIQIPIYDDEVSILYGDKESAVKWISSKYGDDIKISKATQAFCFTENNKEYDVPAVIYIGKKKNDWKYITHELIHYGMDLLDDRNVYIDGEYVEGQEPLCYIVGYLAEKIQNTKWFKYDFKSKKWKTK